MFDRTGHAGAEAAAADWHEHRVELAGLAQELVAQRGGTECGARTLERVDKVAALGPLQLLSKGERRGDVVGQHHLAAEFATGLHPRRVSGPWHRNLGMRAEYSRGVGDRHRVVASTDGGDAAPQRGVIEGLHHA